MHKIAALFAVGMVVATLGVASAAETIRIKIGPENGSGVSGAAVLTDLGDQTQVVIAVTGEPTAGSEPASIHRGQCGGQMLSTQYTLKNVEGGTSTTIIPVTLGDIETSNYAIALYESAANSLNLVGCSTIPAVVTASLPKSGGIPLAAIVLSASVLFTAGVTLRRRPTSTTHAK
jgi:hypothetical protein